MQRHLRHAAWPSYWLCFTSYIRNFYWILSTCFRICAHKSCSTLYYTIFPSDVFACQCIGVSLTICAHGRTGTFICKTIIKKHTHAASFATCCLPIVLAMSHILHTECLLNCIMLLWHICAQELLYSLLYNLSFWLCARLALSNTC